MSVIIAGGGIAGLAAALALTQRGFDVQVLERAAALTEVGLGLQLSPNAMRVIRALGLEEALRPFAFAPEALELRDGGSGQTIFSIPGRTKAEQRWGAPYWHVHRADLLGVLRRALETTAPSTIRLNSDVTDFDETSAGIAVKTADGANHDGNLLIGADGLNSRVRAHGFFPAPPRFTGTIAWRCAVPLTMLQEPPPPTACVWTGNKRHAVTYRLRGGTLANFVGVVEGQEKIDETWDTEGARDAAVSDFKGFDRRVTGLLEQAQTLYRWALYDRDPMPAWSLGRVALLGDAAHPIPPFLAQGAAMALEDAWVLARCLAQTPNAPGQALKTYCAARRPRNARVLNASRANRRLYHAQSALTRATLWPAMRAGSGIAPGFVASRLDWLYLHDVTAASK